MQCGICARWSRTFDYRIIYFHTEMTAWSQSLATIWGLKIPCQVDPGARRRSHQGLKNLLLYCIIFIHIVFIQMKQRFHQLLRLFWFAELSLYNIDQCGGNNNGEIILSTQQSETWSEKNIKTPVNNTRLIWLLPTMAGRRWLSARIFMIWTAGWEDFYNHCTM